MILGIETSCDETAAGIVDSDGRLLANVVASQAHIHAKYGGIVPEIASRRHIYDLAPVVRQALQDADLRWDQLDAVAVTNGPGLAGSLMAGVNFAKGVAIAAKKPLIAVNHLVGHIMAAFIRLPTQADQAHGDRDTHLPLDPAIDMEGERGDHAIMCLIVSGGHTELVLAEPTADRGLGFRIIGQTRDDAAGEAFDKAARAIGLAYPGGPQIQRAAQYANAAEIEPLPRAWMDGKLEFSFSGLKTAVINRAREVGLYPSATPSSESQSLSQSSDSVDSAVNPQTASIARSFQDSVVDVLVTKTIQAAQAYRCSAIALVGGVAANAPLRETLQEESPVPVAVPPISLCTDNGAMIARAGLEKFKREEFARYDLDVIPSLRIS